jgi:hypothetical protein
VHLTIKRAIGIAPKDVGLASIQAVPDEHNSPGSEHWKPSKKFTNTSSKWEVSGEK